MTAPAGLPPTVAASEPLAFAQEAAAASAALAAAARLGVLARLGAGPADAVILARECSIAERGARVLLAALAGLGLVKAEQGGSYRAVAPGLEQLAAFLPLWDHLTVAIRDGEPAISGDTPAGAGNFYPDVVPYLGAMLAPLARRAADHLAASGLRVLDAGAGAAPWSLAIAARYQDVCVTALDLPPVLAATRDAVTAAGLGAQFAYLAGDVFGAELEPGAYDLAVAGNVCHLFDEAANRRLVGRLFDTLRPGGTLAILDALPNEGLDGPRPVVLYALSLLLRTSGGEVYPFSTYAAWLRDAGFQAIERLDLANAPPISLVTAHRPASRAGMLGEPDSGRTWCHPQPPGEPPRETRPCMM